MTSVEGMQLSQQSVDLSYSEDSRDDSIMLLRRDIFNASDVQRCKSQVCLTCNDSHCDPTFVSCPHLNPSEIRKLPRRWWNPEERVVPSSLLEIMSRTLANIFDYYAPQPRNCGCFSDSDSASTVPWFQGSYSPLGHWQPHVSGPQETKADSALAAEDDLIVGKTLTLPSTGTRYHDKNNVSYEVPFDEY